ncbi:MAG: MFS transporter [Acidimicrobiales bacterium]
MGGHDDGTAAASRSVSGWPPFRRLAQAQVAHAAGDALVAVALADTLFFAVPLGEAREQVGLYLALTMAPFAVLSPVVGPLIDRRRGAFRRAIVVAAAARAVLAVLLASRTDRLMLYPLAFGLLVLSRIHGVSRSALVPDVLPPRRSLMWGNAWLAVVSVVGAVAGALPAVGLNHWLGHEATLWVSGAVFAAGAGAAFRLPRSTRATPDRESVGEWRRLLSARLLAGGVAMAGSRAAVGYLTFLLAFLLRGAGETGRGFGVVIAAAGIGGFAGSLVAPALRSVLRESALLLVTLASMAAAALWAAGGFGVTRAAVLAGVVGLASGAGRLAFDSLLQHDAPDVVRGRTFARYETIFQLCWVAGATVATVVPFRAATGMWVLAGGCIISAGLSVRGLMRP